jgi:hypothetical protein
VNRLPANPRRAKRMINHHRGRATIAEDRRVFGGEPALQHRHLAKWVLIVEHWPRLGALLTRAPSKIKAIENAENVEDLTRVLGLVSLEVQDVDELIDLLHRPPRLSPVLARLVRFEPASWVEDGSDAPVALRE